METTGSLARVTKTCHTVREWRRMAEDAQQGADRMIEQGQICPTCKGS